MPKIIDLTHKFTKSMPVCSFDEPAYIEKIRNLAENKYNDWKLSCGMHAGTHIDGPGHFTDSGVLLSDFAVDKFVGKGYLIDARVGAFADAPVRVRNRVTNRANNVVNNVIDESFVIDESLLQDLPKEDGLIVLILTELDKKFCTQENLAQEYFNNHPVMTTGFANALVKRKIKMVGIDFFSPDKYPFEIHKIFFDNNILIIENLTNLDSLLGIKDFTVVALPIKTETDSALARVIAIVN